VKFDGVYQVDDKLATLNSTPGQSVYGERLIQQDGKELRLWNPKRSKLASAILNGLEEFPIKHDSHVLYLGAASGTTASHVCDIASHGMVYCVEFSKRTFRELLNTAEGRRNLIPILADARKPEEYLGLLERCDLIYQDVAQANQSEILIENARMYLREGGHVIIAIKARSIDSARGPKNVIATEIAKLKDVKITQVIDLEPYEKDHSLVVGRWK
jgi:fibrillarin-like pre-rRNA processing protein